MGVGPDPGGRGGGCAIGHDGVMGRLTQGSTESGKVATKQEGTKCQGWQVARERRWGSGIRDVVHEIMWISLGYRVSSIAGPRDAIVTGGPGNGNQVVDRLNEVESAPLP